MNKYPLWKYLLLVSVIGLSVLYALPNLYSPDPAVQISAEEGNVNVSEKSLITAINALKNKNIIFKSFALSEDNKAALIRFNSVEDQLQAKTVVKKVLGNSFIVALNLAENTPTWLQNIGASPMKLGLDLSGGVHFLLEVDTDRVIRTNLSSLSGEVVQLFREDKIFFRKPKKPEEGFVTFHFKTLEIRQAAINLIRERQPDVIVTTTENNGLFVAKLRYTEQKITDIEERALQQNLTALKNRVNELGVSEPLVQRQGRNRIVVELPGIQDTAEAKRIIGKTANLEFRLEHKDKGFYEEFPFRDETVGYGTARLLSQSIVTGESVVDASTGIDENGRPKVNIKLSSKGGDKMHRSTRNNVGRRMGILYLETKTDIVGYQKNEDGIEQPITKQREIKNIISLATIQSGLGVSFQITGAGSQYEAQELALLLRAGALAAPMRFVEERTVGPSLGAENIAAGISSIQWGLLLVVIFMLLYYKAFGLVANVSLAANLVLLTAAMSVLEATLTLPGIAGIVLTLGMAVDANVLIFSRIREELKDGKDPLVAIQSGYDRAWITIFDANVTTIAVAGILYAIGTGAVKGFAVTLIIGILTSMLTAVMGSRALVSLSLIGRKSIQKLWV